MKIDEFKGIDLCDSRIVRFQINGQRVTIDVENVGIFPPGLIKVASEVKWLPFAKLIFEGVSSSRRTVHEYLTQNKDSRLKPPYTIVDGPFPPSSSVTQRHHVEGVLQQPLAWVDWEIESSAFALVADEV